MPKVTTCRAVFFLLFVCLSAHGQSVPGSSADDEALSAAEMGLCKARMVMLGESATHGDGRTVAFKGALIERLVDQCGFDSVLFEASHYEFLHLNRRLRLGQTVSAGDLLSAVGGLWEFDREFQPLASFLVTRAESGKVFLGGLDDQLGQYGQDYANIQMVVELTNLLPQPERESCSAVLHRRVYSDYTEAVPYSKLDRSRIDTCLINMDHALGTDKSADSEDLADQHEMISAAQRWIGRDFRPGPESIVNRDRSMFQDFEWLQNHQPKRHKVIIWSATVHIAKHANPSWGDQTGTNFGAFIHREFGKDAVAVGFSALTGSYRVGGQQIREMPTAPADSVEARALQGSDAAASYVGPEHLTAMGTLPGAFFQHSYQTLPWSTFLDGVVVFQSEHPPTDLRKR